MAFERQGYWRRYDLYTILFIPPAERHPFAVVRLLQDVVEYDEPGDVQFRLEHYDHISLAVDRAEERWAEHRISLDYVHALTGCDDKPLVPTSVSDTLQLTYANLVDIDGVSYPNSMTRRPVPRVHPETSKQPLRDTEYSMSDAWNAPGSFQTRHIVCGVREPGSGLVSIQPSPDTVDAIQRHRQIELDMVQATAGSARWAIAAERWRLQHESTKASATWPQGLVDLAPNRIMFNVARESTDLWRAVTVKHRGQGAHYTTNAEFALYQSSS